MFVTTVILHHTSLHICVVTAEPHLGWHVGLVINIVAVQHSPKQNNSQYCHSIKQTILSFIKNKKNKHHYNILIYKTYLKCKDEEGYIP